MKNYKKTLFLTGMITLMPIISGVLLWNQLPKRIATHFGTDGTPNGWSHRGFVVFGLPLFLLLIHILCTVATLADPKKNNINEKLIKIILWMIPVISIAAHLHIYSYSLGYEINAETFMMGFIGLLFIIIGNYLPKCRQNYTMGIKLPWTLDDEENWNHTHRIAGYLWIICGFGILINAILNLEWLIVVLFFIMAFVPMIYSYLYYKKYGKKE